MDKKQDVIYFDLNNWTRGEDYPDAEPFISWMGNDLSLRFCDEDWVIRNKLVVVQTIVDMSVSFNISAPRKWVEKNCPELLTKYSNFIRTSEDEDELPEPRVYGYFLEYNEENIGIHYDDSFWEDDRPDDEENEEENE